MTDMDLSALAAALNAPVSVVSDQSVLHADHMYGCRVYRVVTLDVGGRVFVQRFWHNSDGSLHRVDGAFSA